MTRELEHLRDLTLVLTQKEIKVRYKNSWLGYAWSIANPLAFGFLYYIAFGVFMRVQIPRYTLFLLTGLFPWQWITNSVGASPTLYISNTTLLKKVHFPSNILVAATVLNDGFHFLLSIPVLLLFLAVYHQAPSWTLLLGVPVLVLLQCCLVYGLALTIASLNLFFRDLERITGLMLMFLFFLTPIVFSVDMIPARYRLLLYLNPVAPLVLNWRDLFMRGSMNGLFLALSLLYGLLAVWMGTRTHRKLSWKFAEVV